MALLTDVQVEDLKLSSKAIREIYGIDELIADRVERTRLLREVLRVYSVARCDELKCGQCDGLHDSQLDDTTLLAEIREAIEEYAMKSRFRRR